MAGSRGGLFDNLNIPIPRCAAQRRLHGRSTLYSTVQCRARSRFIRRLPLSSKARLGFGRSPRRIARPQRPSEG